MHPGVNGKKFPEKPAIVMAGSERIVTHGELNELSNQGAHLFRSLGLKPGDSIAIMLENHFLFFRKRFLFHGYGFMGLTLPHGLYTSLRRQFNWKHLPTMKGVVT